jgi:hypothetical protein
VESRGLPNSQRMRRPNSAMDHASTEMTMRCALLSPETKRVAPPGTIVRKKALKDHPLEGFFASGGAGNRTRVRETSAFATTCVARDLYSSVAPTGRINGRGSRNCLTERTPGGALSQPARLRPTLTLQAESQADARLIRLSGRQRELNVVVGLCGFPGRFYEDTWDPRHATRASVPPSKPVRPQVFKERVRQLQCKQRPPPSQTGLAPWAGLL